MKTRDEDNTMPYNEIFLDNMKQIREYSDFVYACRTQQEKIEELSTKYIQQIESTFIDAGEDKEFYNETYEILNLEEINTMISELKEADVFQDYVCLGDIIEMQTIPLLLNMQSILRNVVTIYTEDNTNFESNLNLLKKTNQELAKRLRNHHLENQEKYILEYTNLGTISLSIQEEQNKYNIHSLHNPFEDGRIFAQRYYKPETKQYVIYGFGFGYHIIMMAQQYKNAKIDVYESDLDTLYLAFSYMDLTELLQNSSVSIHYDPKFQLFGEHLSDAGTNSDSSKEKRVVIYYPSIKTIPFPTIRNLMEHMITQENIQEQAYPLLKDNFINNIKHYEDVADKLGYDFQNKTVFIVAAGPSLDKNVDMLKQVNREASIILATGTVFKKLLNHKIIPDYFIVLDPNQKVYKQIKGVEESTIPMIYLSTAYKGFAQNYQGKKYIILQKEFDLAENLARELECDLYQTGGSVSTIALEVALRLKAKRIVFLGLDLAYTDNFGHAEGTSQRERKEHSEYIEVKSVDGGTVLSSKIFCDFRQWIEERIKTRNLTERKCEIIDATEGGAYIEGTKIMSMDKVIEKIL